MSQRIISYFSQPLQGDVSFKKMLNHAKEEYYLTDYWEHEMEDGRVAHHFLVHSAFSQPLLDMLQPLLDKEDSGRLVVSATEAVLPKPKDETDEEIQEHIEKLKQRNASGIGRISREELYNDIVSGADISMNYLLMVFFSTIVASVGLLYNDIAVIVGAMVIAPFLGPNLALSLSTVLGDGTLTLRAIKSSAAGISLSIIMGVILGYLWPYNLDNDELLRRTEVGFSSIFLALSAGAAAVLSLTKGVSTALVGVMVAAALLPPVAACGLMIGSGQYYHAEGAAVLFAVNIACINIAANIVFISHGVVPHRWYEKEKSRKHAITSFIVWGAGLAFLIFLIMTRKKYFDLEWLF